MHPWHDVELGDQLPKLFPVIIEVPKGSKNKYELDKKSGLVRVDRVLFSSVHYPANYGFVPQTYCGDEDPLDVLVLGQDEVFPLSIMMVKPIGLMKVLDQGAIDDKIIAVHANDPEYSYYNSIDDLSPHRMLEVRRFFEEYKILENKPVIVQELLGPAAAMEAVMAAVELYQKNKIQLMSR